MSFKEFLRAVLGLSSWDVRRIRRTTARLKKKQAKRPQSITRDDRGRWILDPTPASKDQCQCKKSH